MSQDRIRKLPSFMAPEIKVGYVWLDEPQWDGQSPTGSLQEAIFQLWYDHGYKTTNKAVPKAP